MTKKDSWHIKDYEPGDEEGIIRLFELTFGKPMGKTESMKHWRWEYLDNPVGDIYVKLAVDHGEIVGHYAVVPVKMLFNGRPLIGSISIDTMVHPEYRGQGMYRELAMALYQDLDVSLIYGFPNAQSIHGVVKYLGRRQICKVPIMVRPVDVKESLKIAWGSGLKSTLGGVIGKKYYDLRYKMDEIPPELTVERVDDFTDEFDDFWENLRNRISIGVVRDREYLQWRFVDKPEFDYEILALRGDELLGFVVTHRMEYWGQDVLFVMELLTKDFDLQYARYLLSECVGTDAVLVCAMVGAWHPLYNAYRDIGFLDLPPEKFPQDIYFAVREHEGSLEGVYEKENWFITWADTDVI